MDWAQDDPSAEDAVGEFLAICDRDWIADRAYNFHVFLADSDALIGNCALMRRVGPVAIEIGYWIRSDHAGRGTPPRRRRFSSRLHGESTASSAS